MSLRTMRRTVWHRNLFVVRLGGGLLVEIDYEELRVAEA